MRPFDLEAAKRGELICTADGGYAKFIAHVPEAGEFKLVVLIAYETRGRKKHIATYTESGYYYGDRDHNNLDLRMAPKFKTKQVAVYWREDDEVLGSVILSEDQLDNWFKERPTLKLIAVFPFTYEV